MVFLLVPGYRFPGRSQLEGPIRASVASARKNTDLEPNLIYDGEDSEFVEELKASGVNVIFHRLSFTGAIVRHSPNDKMFQAVARGAFLRFDIPLVAEPSDELVLYTDADVMFLEQPRFQGYFPRVHCGSTSIR